MSMFFSANGGRERTRRRREAARRLSRAKCGRAGVGRADVASVIEQLERRELLTIGVPATIGAAALGAADMAATLDVAVTQPVPVGNTILVGVALDPGTDFQSATDSQGNLYTADADAVRGTGASGVRVLVLSAPVTSALAAGDTISITFDSNLAVRAASAFMVSGLLTATPVDVAAAGSGMSAQPTTAALTTVQPDELLFGAVGAEGAAIDFGAGSGFDALALTSSEDVEVFPLYQIASATGTFAIDASLMKSSVAFPTNWAAGLVAYKADVTAPSVVPTGTALDYTEGDGAVAVDGGVVVSDADNAFLSGATVQITGGYQQGEDVLAFADTAAIKSSFNPSTGLLTLTGVATPAEYTAALRSVTFEDASANPSTQDRTVSVAASDFASTTTPAATRTIHVTAVNNAPVLTVPAGQSVDSGQSLTIKTISVSDADADPGSVAVTLAVASGTLSVTPGLPGGLTAAQIQNNGSGSVTLTGPQALIDVTLAQGVVYSHGTTLRNGGMDVLTITANDQGNSGTGGAKTDSKTVNIAVAAVSDFTVMIQPMTGGAAVSATNPALLGQDLTYVVTVANSGPSDASQGVTLAYTLPNNVAYVSSSGSNLATTPALVVNTITVLTNALASGATAKLTVIVTPTAVTTIADQAALSYAGPEINDTANDVASSSVDVKPAADLGVTLTATPLQATALVGQPLTYVLTFTNHGPSVSTSAIAEDTLPAGVTLDTSSIVATGGTYSLSGKVLTLTAKNRTVGGVSVDGLDVGASATLTFTVLPQVGTENTTLVDTAVVKSHPAGEYDPVTSDDSASISTDVFAAADLGVTISASPKTVLVGSDLTFTTVVSNLGPNTSTGARLQVQFSADFNASKLPLDTKKTPPDTYDPATRIATFYLPNILSTKSVTFAVVTIPTAATGNTLIATATVIPGNETDVNALDVGTNNQATDFAGTEAAVDLSLAMSGAPNPVFDRSPLTYTLVVTNKGPNDATNVELTDTLPGIVAFGSATVSINGGPASPITPAALGSNKYAFDLSSLANGATATIVITATPTLVVAGAGASVTNTASVTTTDGAQTELNAADNSASTTTAVNPQVDLVVNVTPQDGPSHSVFVRSNLSYTITVTNNGPSTATQVSLTDVLPAGVTVDVATITKSQGSVAQGQGSLVYTVGQLAKGATATLSFTVSVDPTSTTVNRTLDNTATASSFEAEKVPSDNTFTASTRAIDAGFFQIEQAAYTVSELVGVGYLTGKIERKGGTENEAFVTLTSADGAGVTGALLGTNYGALYDETRTIAPGVGNVLTFDFAPGVASKTFFIPIFDDLKIHRDAPGGLIFSLALSNATDHAVLGSQIAAQATITEGDTLVVTDPGDGLRQFDAPGPLQPAPTFAPGTLRHAITVANNTPNAGGTPDTITFNVPIVAPATQPTVTPLTDLPTLDQPVIIDATQGFNGPPVRLDAAGATDGLVVTAGASGSTIQGLVITGAGGAAIHVEGDGNLIRGNSLGYVGGSVTAGNAVGLLIDGGTGNTIGGTGAGDRNVISGNTGDGVKLVAASGNVIVGNRIGTDASGAFVIGGVSLGNGGAGIEFVGASNNNAVGGTDPALANIISNNSGAGVLFSPGGAGEFGAGDAIRGNSIDANAPTVAGGKGIDNGANPNTPASPPVVALASSVGNSTNIQGTIEGIPLTRYVIDFYATPPTPTGKSYAPQGRTYVVGGSTEVLTDASGHGEFNVYVDGTYSASSLLTATATFVEDSSAMPPVVPSTSEFSAAAIVTGGLFVTNTNDDGPGSLRANLRQANAAAANGSAARIAFAIPLNGNVFDGASFIIRLKTSLEDLANPFGITIDAASERTNIGGLPTGNAPLVVIDGSNVAPGTTADPFTGTILNSGLTLASNRNAIFGLTVRHFAGAGILINGGSDNTIGGAFGGLGVVVTANGADGIVIQPGKYADGAAPPQATTVTGSYHTADRNQILGATISANVGAGIRIVDGSNNLIGGALSGEGNAIFGNSGEGIAIVARPFPVASDPVPTPAPTNPLFTANSASGNAISGNLIGLVAATSATANGGSGISLLNAANGLIGGAATGAGNTISGNVGAGVSISGASATGNVLAGNWIGLDLAGTAAMGNSAGGVVIAGAPRNVVGGADPTSRNVISGNVGAGVSIVGAAAVGNLVSANAIGTDVAGSAAVANVGPGVAINGAPATTVGGLSASAGNLISGNAGAGISASGSTATGLLIGANFIGVKASGSEALPNGSDGIALAGISGDSSALIASNIVSGNRGLGLSLASISSALVTGNVFGLTSDRATALGNSAGGVSISGGSKNSIGGATDLQKNVISGNIGDGIVLGATTLNLVAGNLIGLNGAGNSVIGNAGDGIRLSNASLNIIGGTDGVSGNTVTGNAGSGVHLLLGSQTNLVAGNYIGAAAGAAPNLPKVAPGNSMSGIAIENAPSNMIGGTLPGAGNVIVGNRDGGISVGGVTSTANLVEGNTIGLAADGSTPQGNGRGGVLIVGAPSNIVGDTVVGGGNVISGNVGPGVSVTGAGATGNIIAGNFIGTDRKGIEGQGNAQAGVVVDGSAMTTILRNVISDNQGVGIDINGASTLVQENKVGTNAVGNGGIGNAGTGIVVHDLTGTALLDNVVADSGFRRMVATAAAGVSISGSAANTTVQGNRIGTNAAGDAALGNNGVGLIVVDAQAIQIRANLVSGNRAEGVTLLRTDGASVVSNSIGVNATGGATGNALAGLSVSSVVGLAIGGNVISGNLGQGLVLSDSRDVSITGNRVGTDAPGVIAVPNALAGILLSGDTATTVGGSAAGAGNVISGNGGAGVSVFGGSNIVLFGNAIGVDRSGASQVKNTGDGIDLGGGVRSATIGATAAGAANTIGGNGGSGIAVNSATGALIVGNLIGLASNGLAGIANGGFGVSLAGSASITDNTISANASGGVLAVGDGAGSAIEIARNIVGLDGAGKTALGNRVIGIDISGFETASILANQVAASDSDGIHVAGLAGSTVTAASNIIGLSSDGQTALRNGGTGLVVMGFARAIVQANKVAANGTGGIALTGSDGSIVTATDNLIGLTGDGLLTRGNGGIGLDIEGFRSASIAGNAIAASGAGGLLAKGDNSASSSVTVSGNNVGLTKNGTPAQGNGGEGVFLGQISSASVTDNAVAASGAGSDGVHVEGTGLAASSVTILRNVVGLARDGVTAQGNTGEGVDLRGFATVLIQNNVVSSNTKGGIHVVGTDAPGSTITVSDNIAGLTADATTARANEGVGGASETFRGLGVALEGFDSASLLRNTVSANARGGIRAIGSTVSGVSPSVVVDANVVGLNGATTAAFGNGGPGVELGSILAASVTNNILSANTGGGLKAAGVSGATSTAVVESNIVGLDGTSSVAMGNGGIGIDLAAFLSATVRKNNVAASGGDAVRVTGSIASSVTAASNTIGQTADGHTAIRDGQVGLSLVDFASATVSNNAVAASGTDGISLVGSAGSTAEIDSNFVGLLGDGSASADPVIASNFGDGGVGIRVEKFRTLAIANNAVAASGSDGVRAIGDGDGASGATIRGNNIGLARDGSAAQGNGGIGISLGQVASASIAGNRVAGNALGGLKAVGIGAAGTRVAADANIVGLTGDGLTPRGNGLVGLDLSAFETSVVTDLAVAASASDGIRIVGTGVDSSSATVTGNVVGLDGTGNAPRGNEGNGGIGVSLAGISTATVTGNTVSASTLDGVRIVGTAATSSAVTVARNVVGLTGDGVSARGNGVIGVNLSAFVAATIASNTVSANAQGGIKAVGSGMPGSVVTIDANVVGLSGDGASARGNGGVGIDASLYETANVTNNIVASSTSDGVRLHSIGSAASGVSISNNDVGLTSGGASRRGNGGIGLVVDGFRGVSVTGNRVAANGLGGLAITGDGKTPSRLLVASNTIGLIADGTAAGNGGNGVLIQSIDGTSAPDAATFRGNTVAASARLGVRFTAVKAALITQNLVYGNADGGFLLEAGSSSSVVSANTIGATTGLPQGTGLEIRDSSGDLVEDNAISGSRGAGVQISGSSSANVVRSNRVLASSGDGVRIASGGQDLVTSNLIQGSGLAGITIAGSRGNAISANSIGGNLGDGIAILRDGGSDSANNQVIENLIGTYSGASHPNLGNGVLLQDVSANTVGGNRIAFNLRNGVQIQGASNAGAYATGNLVTRNHIGLDADPARGGGGNAGDGVTIVDAPGNTVSENAIFSNSANGIQVVSTRPDPADAGRQAAHGNRIAGNHVGVLGGTADLSFKGDGSEVVTIAPGADLGNKGNGVAIVNTDGTVVTGNEVGSNRAVGVLVAQVSRGTVISSNVIGLSRAGDRAAGNFGAGIELDGTASTTVAANMIGGNRSHGILVAIGSSGATVSGNTVGLDAASASAAGLSAGSAGTSYDYRNGLAGVFVSASMAITVDGNRILGNGQNGVVVFASGQVTVSNNLVGRDTDPGKAPSNLGDGVVVLNSTGATSLLNNAIAGNTGSGVDAVNVDGLLAQGNRIFRNGGDGVAVVSSKGTNVVTGNVIFGNARSGVEGASNDGLRVVANQITGNVGNGVLISGSTNAIIVSNAIGTDLATGATALPNLGDGVFLIDSSASKVLQNEISANSGYGVRIEHSPKDLKPDGSFRDDATLLAGNLIGTDPGLTADVGNGLDGVFLHNALGVTIGGVGPGSRNVIAFNRGHGIDATEDAAPARNPATLQVIGNLLRENRQDGILLSGVAVAQIGSAAPGGGNTIAFNASAGVEISGVQARARIVGNRIGLDPSDHSPRAMMPGGAGNNAVGVYLNDARSITVGGTTAAERNVISGNFGPGVQIFGITATAAAANLVQGNYLGMDDRDGAPVSRTFASEGGAENRVGVFIIDSPGNTIGGTAPGAGNVISGNDYAGVSIFGQNATNNVIVGNVIGGHADGSPLVPYAGDDLTQPVGHQDLGVLINAVAGNRVAGNTIVGNLAGVEIVGIDPESSSGQRPGNAIAGNILRNNGTAIYINASVNNTIGGSAPGAGNLITDNELIGVSIVKPLSSGNLVAGNTIRYTARLAADGSKYFNPQDPNKYKFGTGIYIEQAQRNIIGVSAASGKKKGARKVVGAANTFIDNAAVDVYIAAGAAGNSVRGNAFKDRTSYYGVLLYNAPGNIADVILPGQGSGANKFPAIGRGPTIANFRIYNQQVDPGVGAGTFIPAKKPKKHVKGKALPAGPAAHFHTKAPSGHAALHAAAHRHGLHR